MVAITDHVAIVNGIPCGKTEQYLAHDSYDLLRQTLRKYTIKCESSTGNKRFAYYIK